MPVNTICPSCQSAYTLPDEFLDRRVMCKNCKEAFFARDRDGTGPVPEQNIPVQDERRSDRDDPPRRHEDDHDRPRRSRYDDRDDRDRDHDRDRGRRRRYEDYDDPPPKKSSKGLVIGLVCGGLVLVLGCGGLLGLIAYRSGRMSPGGDMTLTLVGGSARVSGQITRGDRRDPVRNVQGKVYRVQFQAGKTYKIDHRSTAYDAYLRLVAPNGNEVANNDDGGGNRNARIVFVCTVGGEYQIHVTPLVARYGAFDLEVQEQAGGPPMSRLTLVGGRVAIAGSLMPTDARDPVRNLPCKAYIVPMQAGRTYQIDHRSTAYDAYLRLAGPAGNPLAENDDGGGNQNSRIIHHCTQTGDYLIYASAFGGGRFGAFVLEVLER